MSRKVIISDDYSEKFKRSDCSCQFCRSMHTANEEWGHFVPRTNLQKNMISVVDRIETRNKEIRPTFAGKTDSGNTSVLTRKSVHEPVRRSLRLQSITYRSA